MYFDVFENNTLILTISHDFTVYIRRLVDDLKFSPLLIV